MSQNLSFDLKIPDGSKIELGHDYTFENFIGQFQTWCPKILCIVNGVCLRYYDGQQDTIPKNLRFDYKQQRNGITEYYFRDIYTNTVYCVFNREAAKIFYPRLDDVESGRIPDINKLCEKMGTEKIGSEKKSVEANLSISNFITIIDEGTIIRFQNHNYPVEIIPYNYSR